MYIPFNIIVQEFSGFFKPERFNKDTLQKISLIAFAQAIRAMMGDTRKVIGFYPTELIIPTFRHKFMDGVLILMMER